MGTALAAALVWQFATKRYVPIVYWLVIVLISVAGTLITDTMTDTAKVLGQAKLAKTIILTGAMIPFKFGSSDGLFNMGCAIGFAQALPHGVYIAMNGRFFNWDNVRKNRKRGEFEELNAD
jgi:L-asparaginase/Glu-tRNA(Gln) amidotransferase subunit D